jgi:hypothetical protein
VPLLGSRPILRRTVLGFAVAVAIAQLIPAGRTNPPVRSDVEAPDEVKAILRRACYDCHSHETRWPWYSRVAPVSWYVVSHVDEARNDLNFSDWPIYDFDLQEMALRDIRKQVSSGKMPLRSYRLMHSGARLGQAEREALIRWTNSAP